MKQHKNTILFFSIYAILLALINILVFTIFKPWQIESEICLFDFWFSYAFMTLAFLLQMSSIFLYDKKTGLNAVFFGLPLSIVSLIYFVIEAFFAILFMILSAFAVETPTVLVSVLQILLLGIFAVIFIISLLTKNAVTAIEKNQKEKVQTIRFMVDDLDLIIASIHNEKVQKEVIALQEDIRYSDPMSTPETHGYDEKLKMFISMINDALSSPDSEQVILTYVNQARLVVKQRNNRIRSAK